MGEHIPTFGSREEEAEFWQKTGLDALAPGELEEVHLERSDRPLSTTFAVRFDTRTVELLRRVARAQEIGPTQLVRAWVLERLRLERSVGVLADPRSDFPADFELTLRRKVVDTLMSKLPEAAEEAIQEVLDRADQEAATLRDSMA
jgi:hypothetical protein